MQLMNCYTMGARLNSLPSIHRWGIDPLYYMHTDGYFLQVLSNFPCDTDCGWKVGFYGKFWLIPEDSQEETIHKIREILTTA
jgi:hypothetical protein